MIDRTPAELCEELRQWLAHVGRPDSWLAAEAGISQATASRYIRGKPPKKVTTVLRRLCNYAKIEIKQDVTTAERNALAELKALRALNPRAVATVLDVIRALQTLLR